MLDDQDRVAQVAQRLQDFNEPAGVAGMQPNGGFVQHIERTHQVRAERRRQLNSLRLTSGKCRRQPVERQVFQADLVKEFQSRADFVEHLVRHRLLFRG